MINLRRLLKKIPFLQRIVCSLRKSPSAPDCDLTEIRMALVKIHHPELNQEADYILQNLGSPEKWYIPYSQFASIDRVISKYDRKLGLPYVFHGDKRLYFPSSYSEELCEKIYKGYIERECLLGGKYREKQPHQYESELCKISKGDCLVDIGCAEALFTLAHIDDIVKAYLIEGDKNWMPALNATFKAYRDKVVIINKYISDINTDNTITLDSIISKEKDVPIFIKMDIEGTEHRVLANNREILRSMNHIKLAICTYHRQQDAEDFSALFTEMGYQYEFSDGYTYIYRRDFHPVYPYFRHGVIRGWK